ncbi:hypothetical protein [Natronorubrum daqingense]|uniref:Uncharacterized protein n=1 Tax=Natronorubrum daqingense TaxID=588898 RepID=A0A1N7FA15_9EURY|nr:hypothetical protein [Natronorubrum daqingense]APX97640.1 hypothetical protein BB347_14040 [Natronorubrum daqingense]SIR97177.1 hypothetical protein SAMN05421809_3133 [Natronorubrum daqingense]
MTDDSPGTRVFETIEPDPDAVLEAFDVDAPDDLLESGRPDDADGDDGANEMDDIEIDDTTAAELFDELAAIETTDGQSSQSVQPTSDGDSDVTADGSSESDAGVEDATVCPADHADSAGHAESHGVGDALEELAFEFVGDSDVIVREEGDAVESTAAELSALTAGKSTAAEDESEHTESRSLDDGADAIGSTDGTVSSGTHVVDSAAVDGFELVGPDPTPTRVTNDAFGSVEVDAR